jgi:hypothetical protein
MEFIDALRKASVNAQNEDEVEVFESLLHPFTEPLDVPDRFLRLSIKLFISTNNSSEETYNQTRDAILECYPEDNILTFSQVKRHVAKLSGVHPLRSDMCPNTCMAYTGPFEPLEKCPYCAEPRYDPLLLDSSDGAKKKPQRQFYTIPIGPQLQALWRTPRGATEMRYSERVTEKILRDIGYVEGQDNPLRSVDSFDDFFYGSDYLQAVVDKKVKAGDMILMIALDGAQLYQLKLSDCWIYIWVVLNHAPDVRYKKVNVLPGGFIGGPNKPKHVDSFTYVGLHHIKMIQNRGGLKIWDGARNETFTSNLFIAIAAADTPGLVYFTGLVGHHGKCGCRTYCALKGRRKPGGPHYYPVRLKPNNYAVDGCDHPDVDLADFLFEDSDVRAKRYTTNLDIILNSENPTQFEKRRLETGITKPSIFMAFAPNETLGIPNIFSQDIMHLADLNIPTLSLDLWRGTMDCSPTDDRATWDWAALQGETWKAHGKAVADCKPYLPGSFDRPPRNIAEKINSGYKAWEFLLYFYVLGPGLLYGILPHKYWKHYCKLVYAMRIIHQPEILAIQLTSAHVRLSEWSTDYELMYVQRRADRLHMVRPCAHSVSHLPEEVGRVGPASYTSQWVLERTIGNLGEEIRQHSNPYANLSERGLNRSQLNALYAMVPDLDPTGEEKIPRGSKILGDGYILLRAMDNCSRPVRACEGEAIRSYMKGMEVQVSEEQEWCPSIVRWARLRLPNGQIARSAWKEKLKQREQVQMARHVKVRTPQLA